MPEEKKTAAQRLKELADVETAFWEKQGDEKPTAEQQKELDTRWKEIEDLSAEVDEENKVNERKTRLGAIKSALSKPVHEPAMPGGEGKTRDPQHVLSAGEEFLANPEIKQWIERLSPNGTPVNEKQVIQSPVVDMKSLVMSVPASAGGALVRRDYGPWPIDLPLRPRTIRDVITVLRTGSNLIEYVRVNSLTRAAAIVPEATSVSDDAALKPKSAMSLEVVQTGVKTIAVVMNITRTILADAPQLQSMIDAFQNADLELALEEEIISGAGGANHFTGLENTAGLTPQAFDTDDLTTTRKARTKAQIVGRSRSTGFLMNPYDWEALDLTKDAENRYYFGGPLAMGTKMLWGLPVIESEVIPQGTAYTGDLKQMVVWDRELPSMYITDSNRDYFERNIISILTEQRAAFGVLRPAAIVKIDLHQGANS